MAKKKITNSVGQVRIIGGFFRGHKLKVIDRPGLRPTANRVRETLFNWLTPVIQGAHCLDCFAGSGALGFEALSRAASSVTLLEQDYAISMQLTQSLITLKTKHAKVISTNSLLWLAQPGSIFDIVFIDPPFHHGIINSTVDILEYYQRLSDNAWIYIETEKKSFTPKVPAHWQLHRKKIAGQVAYFLYIRHTTLKKGHNTH
ncbi:Ribosomal RNA small subunit methyltransferase D [Candidatus Gullanella endobia]|uniref:Ribosomal RNA small subunit methyltransferase D n=1 Tax=Candidatus Gullanella endobia TaxID=1070130 RepID=A0A143WRD9_9ENTR|nr:16S rRNA (guanine(966)-N(2))-methyltransferase RsmD [Candidatus Gullanella endobia]CUX96171.1 Ribosomal RNA small subunit methyltransferase D [Candidatus Gullanella endobia]